MALNAPIVSGGVAEVKSAVGAGREIAQETLVEHNKNQMN